MFYLVTHLHLKSQYGARVDLPIKHQMFQTHVDLSDRNVMNILA